MVEFAQINKNPKGRKTGDCSTRALCNVLQISYEEALKLQYEMALKCYYDMTSKEVLERILKEKGYVKHKQPRKFNGLKYKVNEIDELVSTEEMENGVIIIIAHHWTICRDYIVEDLWDCRFKTINNYWTKE